MKEINDEERSVYKKKSDKCTRKKLSGLWTSYLYNAIPLNSLYDNFKITKSK